MVRVKMAWKDRSCHRSKFSVRKEVLTGMKSSPVGCQRDVVQHLFVQHTLMYSHTKKKVMERG